MKHRLTLIILILTLIGMLATACSNKEANQPEQTEPPATQKESPTPAPSASSEPTISEDPVTLSMYIGVALGEEEIERQILAPVRNQHPHITLKILTNKDGALADMITANQTPDLYFAGAYMQVLFDLEYQMDLQPLIDKHNVDLSSVDQDTVDFIRTISGGDQFLAMPFSKNMMALWYNKAIFDRFNVDYPTDGMTWEDAFTLATKLSQTSDGIEYRGITPLIDNDIRYSGMTYSLPFVNETTGKAEIDSKWASLFQLALNGYQIPGNLPEPGFNPLNAFVKDQTLAMYTTLLNKMNQQLENAPNLDWDVVQMLSFPDLPDMTIPSSQNQFAIAKTSKFPDQAMQVLVTLISDEAQLAISRMGRIPVSTNPAILEQFAAESETFKGKNVQGIFKSKAAAALPTTPYDGIVQNALRKAFTKVLYENVDINTALLQAEEEANVAIDAAKAK